jgi:DNA-directed RNA polymerase specialized sigma24 family protein
MERIAKLVLAAAEARRKIWASLPFGVRLAEFMSRLASSTTDAFGKVMYAAFLNSGVTDMPDINGKPASEFDLARKPIANRLPNGYGRDFGKKVFLILMGRLHNPETVEELMQDFALKFLEEEAKHMKPGWDLTHAQNYVLRAMQNRALNRLRLKHEVSDVLGRPGDEEESHSIYDVTPSFDEASAEKLFNERMLPKVRSKLNAIHPDAERYVRLSLLEGYKDREIVGDPEHGIPTMLDHAQGMTERNWNSHIKPKIFKVLKDNFQDLR